GTAGLTFRTGISELWFSAGAWSGILVVYFIAARVRKIAQVTLTDLLEQRYNRLAKILGTVTIIIAYMVIAGYQFKGGGRFISILSQGSISPETGMLFAAALIVGFTVLAGMVSIVSIDVFNGSIMLLTMAEEIILRIGYEQLPALMAAFFWKRVTRIGGVASIASGMLTVIGIVILNTWVKNISGEAQLYGFTLPVDTDYIAIPAVVVSILTLIVVSLLTKRPDEKDWAGFIES
ncbi:MAG: hypothetical protein MUP31_07720, partial [Xanthomonadales bacterium]|nr:hypothetical protein [Xanthomonadales bacterium]